MAETKQIPPTTGIDSELVPAKTVMMSHLQVQSDLEKKGIISIILILLFFGLTDLFSEIYIDEIIKLADPNLNIQLPEPSYVSIFSSIFSDMLSIGIIVAIFFGFRAFSGEISVDKQVYYFMARPITRRQYYLTKSIIRSIGLVLAIFITSMIAYGLAAIYLPPMSFVVILGGTWIVILGVIANFHLALMFNAKYSSGITALLTGGFFFFEIFVGSFATYIKWLKWTSPMNLASIWSKILMNQDFSNFTIHSIVLLLWIIIPLIVGTYWYDNRDL